MMHNLFEETILGGCKSLPNLSFFDIYDAEVQAKRLIT